MMPTIPRSSNGRSNPDGTYLQQPYRAVYCMVANSAIAYSSHITITSCGAVVGARLMLEIPAVLAKNYPEAC